MPGAADIHGAVAGARESLEGPHLPLTHSPIVTASGRLRHLPESPGLPGDKAKRSWHGRALCLLHPSYRRTGQWGRSPGT